METRSFDDMAALIRAARSIAICGHIHPDGDCLGSTLALHHALKRMGKEVTPLLAQEGCTLREYSFMSDFDDLVAASAYDTSPDLFISVDVPNLRRMGDGVAVHDRAARTLAFDHHLGTDMDMADYCFSDPDAAACSMVIWDFIDSLGLSPEPEEATDCFVGVVTDTGRFQYQNADARAFGYATDFVLSGAYPCAIANNVYLSRSMPRVQLEARCTQRLTFECGGKLVYSWICPQDYDELGATLEDGEELTDCVRSIAGADICMLLRENDGFVRGSLRAKDDSDVAAVARMFNGGGHKAAAGFTFYGNLQECLDALLPELRKLVK